MKLNALYKSLLLMFSFICCIAFGQTTTHIGNPNFQQISMKWDTIFHTSTSINDSLRVDSLVIARSLSMITATDTFWQKEIYHYDMIQKKINYYPSGKIKFITFFEKGKKMNIHSWYENGNKEDVMTYTDTSVSSTGWYESGKLQYKYDSNMYYEWYESGKLKEEAERKEGEIDGAWKQWCEDGQKMRFRVINKGRYIDTAYYCNGQIHHVLTYISQPWYLVGKLTAWYDNGIKQLENYYKNSDTIEGAGIRTGVWKYWDEKGNLLKKEYYKDNELIKTKSYLPTKIER